MVDARASRTVSDAMRDFEGGIFWGGLNVHTFNCLDRADRRVKGLVAEGWVDGWGVRNGWFAKVDNSFGYEKWT